MLGHEHAPRLQIECVVGNREVAFTLFMRYQYPLLYVTSHMHDGKDAPLFFLGNLRFLIKHFDIFVATANVEV